MLGDAAPGSELWYAYVTPDGPSIGGVRFIDIDGEGVAEFHIDLSDACSWYLDKQGNVVSRGIGSACRGESQLNVIPRSESRRSP